MWLYPYHLSVCQKYLGEGIISTVETRCFASLVRDRVETKTETRGIASKHRIIENG
ncbi:MAG: hypothetical protein VSS75_007565 [Candidatus Parabeggiatoa sp.]|nr:hypothetical protein [Candidatus Parabeggiatoa sp.]